MISVLLGNYTGKGKLQTSYQVWHPFDNHSAKRLQKRVEQLEPLPFDFEDIIRGSATFSAAFNSISISGVAISKPLQLQLGDLFWKKMINCYYHLLVQYFF